MSRGDLAGRVSNNYVGVHFVLLLKNGSSSSNSSSSSSNSSSSCFFLFCFWMPNTCGKLVLLFTMLDHTNNLNGVWAVTYFDQIGGGGAGPLKQGSLTD